MDKPLLRTDKVLIDLSKPIDEQPIFKKKLEHYLSQDRLQDMQVSNNLAGSLRSSEVNEESNDQSYTILQAASISAQK